MPQEQIHHSHRCSVVLGCSEVKYTEFVTSHVRLLALSKTHHEYSYVGTLSS